jgi:hypothetical protein
MKNEIIVKNKGSSNELKNLQRLDETSQRPVLKLLSPGPARIEETSIQETERVNCRELWNRFITWGLATLLRYAKCFILLGFTLLLFIAKEKISGITGAEGLFSILGGISFVWLIVEWIEAYTDFSIKDLLNKWFNKLFPK